MQEFEQKLSESIKKSSKKFDAYRFPQKSVNLLDSSPSISYDQTNETCGNLLDRTAFSHKYAEELTSISQLQDLIDESNYYINMLYTYRSISKPLPMIPADLNDTDKKTLYKTVFDILTPNVLKIKGLMEFNDRFIKAFIKNLRLLVFPYEKKDVMWQDHLSLLLGVIDKFFVLDLLKDVKGQIRNDFSRYKRAFSFVRSILHNAGELMAEITAIHNFLNDPQHPNHIILYQLKQDITVIPHREALFAIIINKGFELIKKKEYITPYEKHSIYRSILAALYLCDDNKNGINVFKSKHLKNINKIRDLVKKLCILPVFMDIHTTAPIALSICDNFTKDMRVSNQWMDKKHHKTYDLIRWRSKIQSQYISYTASFVTFLHNLRAYSECEENINILHLGQEGVDLVIRGMTLIGDWTAKLAQQMAYKSANPISETEYLILSGKLNGDNNPYKCYEQITRFNYKNELKYAMVEIIGLIKGLSNLLLNNETSIRVLLSNYIYIKLQDFMSTSLIYPLNKSFKKKKENLENLLLSIRLCCCDNGNVKLISSDYKTKKEKEIKKNIKQYLSSKKQRKLYPSKTQIYLIRRLLFSIFSDTAAHQQAGVLFGHNFLSKSQVKEFNDLYVLLGNILYISDYKHVIISCSDLSFLWYREFYLNLTDCIQFPISMSIPWMLTDFAMSTPSLAPNVFFPLSIYNDCGEYALSKFNKQHLFDEIEAEVNLVFDQLIFTLYRKIFDYYKNKASKILLDKQMEVKLMKKLSSKVLGTQLQLPLAHYGCIFNCKNVSILGRNIDIESLLTEQLNCFIRENIEIIITRYEQNSTITSVIEIEHLLKTLRLTCDMLYDSGLKGLDSFDIVLQEINEDTTLGSFRGRLFLTTYNKLFSNLLRNSIYNQLTQRFVSLQRPKGRNKNIDSLYLWGSRFTSILEQRFKITRGFFGIEHIEAIVELMGIDSMPLLIDETVKTVAHIIIRDISPYVEEILVNLDPMKLQSAYYGVLGVYGYYDLSLKYIKSYPALREGVFTLLREAGNALCFVQLLDIVLCKQSYYNYQIRAFYNGGGDKNQFENILKETHNKIKYDEKLSDLFKSCLNSVREREKYFGGGSGGWLFSATLQYLDKNLRETGLLKKWKGSQAKNGILEHENPKDFSRFWSVATFIFLVPDYTPKEEEEKRKKEGYICDRAYFGDGWLWCGTTILYLTNLIHRYKLLDPTLYLDKLQRLYPVNLNKSHKKSGIFSTSRSNKHVKKLDPKTAAYKPFVKGLLNAWQDMENDQELIISILKSHFVIDKEPITRFSPKWHN